MTREEAIKIIESNCSCSGGKLQEACAIFIPELRESEDEKIRKSIIHILQVGGYMPDEEKKKAFAYLERQKYEYEVFEPIESTLEYKAGFRAGIESERQKEQKPTEWSEEDEKMIARICANLEYLIKEAGCDSKLKEKLEERIKWMQRLKSLCLQQKYEWSEADEKDLIQLIENGITETICKKGFKFHFEDEYAKELVKYIKAFNPQPYWKPSKEQMECLQVAASQYRDSEVADTLWTLVDDLKSYSL